MVLASNFGCSADVAIFGFHNVKSKSDKRQVGGIGNDICKDQKSGRVRSMILHLDFARASPIHIPLFSQQPHQIDLQATAW